MKLRKKKEKLNRPKS